MLPKALLERIADGCEHSRRQLCASLELDAGALENQVRQLEFSGLNVVSTGDDSLRLRSPLEWIDVAQIESALAGLPRRRIESIELAFEAESTNRQLLDCGPPARTMTRVAIAEYQTAGRGRRGRRWTMPPGTGVALSAAWRFGPDHRGLEALSLAVGAAARRAVRDATSVEIGLKWPNDLVVDGAKLGGILVELSPLADGECHAVVGIGINVDAPTEFLARASDLPHGACDLASVAPQWAIDRAGLVARLIERLVELFIQFPDTGFEPYRAEWLGAHVLDGKPVELSLDSGTAFGTVIDIGPDGALVVECDSGERQRVISGDVTLRARR